MFVGGFARSPLRFLVLLAVAYALAHWVLGPAGVQPAAQIAITLGATFILGLILSLAASAGRTTRTMATNARCSECGGDVSTGWRACPHCGVELTGVSYKSPPG